MEDFSVGSVVKGVVTGIKSYGIFVKLENGYTGLVHISEITDKFVSDINKFANIGENVYVEIKDFYTLERVTLFARPHRMKITSAVYQYLKRAVEEELLTYRIEMT